MISSGPGSFQYHGNPLTDRILVGPVLPRHALADDHASCGGPALFGTKQPAAHETDSHRAEEVVRDHANVGHRFLADRRFRAPDDFEVCRGAQTVQRQEARSARGLHTGDGVDLLEELVVEAANLLGRFVPRLGNRDPHRDRVRRIESGVHAEKSAEAADQQAGADQEHERECHLDHDERVSGTSATSTRASAPAFLERVRQRGPRRRESREEPEREAADERRDEREQQHTRIDGDGLEPRNRKLFRDDAP